MWTWTSWLVLAVFTVITQSFPQPGADYKIPQVPLGRRAQYYVLHDNGDYKYGHDTGAGAYESAVRMGDDLFGYFGYNDAFGEKVRVDYTAGAEGFRPTGSHLPEALKSAVERVVDNVILKSATTEVKRPVEIANIRHQDNLDGSYSFSFTNSDSSRSESSDTANNVIGEYSFIADDGVNRVIRYKAGSETGFIAEGDSIPTVSVPVVPAETPVKPITLYSASILTDLPSPLATQGNAQPRGDASYSFSYQNADSSRDESADSDLNVKGRFSFVADDGLERTVNYIAGAETGFVAEGAHLPVAPEVAAAEIRSGVAQSATVYTAPVPVLTVQTYSTNGETFQPRGDASYQFSYTTGESSRRETSDRDLNIEGEYSFVGDDGVTRRVNYIAGSATGFVAVGDHLPVVPVDVAAATRSSVAQTQLTPQALVKSAPTSPLVSHETAAIRSSTAVDGSYRFSYNNADSSRSETADAFNNVVGKYSFVADDGIIREIRYKAGSETGFIAEGDSIPVAPEIPTIPVVPAVEAQPASFYSAPTQTDLGTHSTAERSFQTRGDASYSFNYQNVDSSRDESADRDLNVKGSFSFVADDGVERTVKYIAGSGTGFIAEGVHLPVAPEVPAVGLAHTAAVRPAPTVALAQTYSAIEEAFQPRADASYSFSYQNVDSSRDETADSDLNVRGRFSFISDDGVERTVNYVAGSGTGFVAEGVHLPVAPHASAAHATGSGAVQSETLYTAPSPVAPVQTYSAAEETFEPKLDGSYKFSYTTGESSRREVSDRDLNIEGEYSFLGDDGVWRRVNYIAGSATGFVAEGDHLPVAPVNAAGVTRASQTQTQFTPQVLVKSAPTSPSVSHETAVIRSLSALDGSYSFSYNTADSSRSETSDAFNNVVGKYSFVADDGIIREIRYKAGSETGFIAEGDSIPVAPEIPAVPVVPAAEAHTVSLYSAPTQLDSGTHSTAERSFQTRGDSSYSFNYQNIDSSRDESADRDLNVKGSFSFVADDGVERTVNYIAGSGTGFIAEGAHLPVAPEIPVVGVVQTAAVQVAPSVASVQTYSAVEEIFQPRGDASYSFSYQNVDSSRAESADRDLNVKGTFSFVADDDVERTVNYIAGSGTGFIAEGAHLPVAPEALVVGVVPTAAVHVAPSVASVQTYSAVETFQPRGDASYSFNYQNVDSSRTESADRDLNVKGTFSFVAADGVERTVNYIAGSETGFIAEGAHLPVAPAVPAVNAVRTASVQQAPSAAPVQTYSVAEKTFQPRGDASYSFNYQNVDSSRDEFADNDLNVKGRFSFVADDGVERIVNYIAGSKTGFIAEGDHLPVAPKLVAVTSVRTAPFASVPSISPVQTYSTAGETSQPRGDASYSFTYQNADSSRDEKADSDLNVKGSYSFVADDGVQRTVNYIAGSGTGFVATGAHIPVHVVHGGVPITSSGANGVPGGVGTHQRTATVYSAPTTSHTSSSSSSTETIIGNVLLHQYPATGSKFGYAYTQV